MNSSRRIAGAIFPFWLFLMSSSYAASIEELAKAEGEVVLYSSIHNERSIAFRHAFERKHPFLKVNYFRATGERLTQRIITEAQAGRHSVDAFSMGGFRIHALKERGFTGKYVLEESRAFPEGFRDPEGHWTNLHSLLICMGYNMKLVRDSEVPKSYPELHHPRWKGKIGLNITDAEWFMNMTRIMGRARGLDLMRKLAAQQPGLHGASSLLAQLLAAGEFHLVVNLYGNSLVREKEKGAPVHQVFIEPIITYLHPIALARYAPHPNAARLFINFMLSKEGQTVIASDGMIPSRSDVESKILEETRNMRLFPSDPSIGPQYEAANHEYRLIFLGK